MNKTPLILGMISIPAAIAAQERPNVLLILADDLGYGSVNPFGAERNIIRTPHIQYLSDHGIRFTNACTPASVSSPTRYGLMTGCYPMRSENHRFGVLHTSAPLALDHEKPCLADLFKSKGYRTAAIGKWHLGYTDNFHDFTGQLKPGTEEVGFDYHFGIPQNNDDFTGVYIENDYVYGLRSTKSVPYSRSYYGEQYAGLDAPQRDNKNVMQTLTDKSIEWLRSSDKDQPFFLYFAASAVHHPMTPSDKMRGMSQAGPYGDFIQELDYCVGQLIETLEYMGVLDNTIIIFTSDNGGDIPEGPRGALSPEIYAQNTGLKINGTLRGDKHTIWQGGTNVPFITYWKGKVSENSVTDEVISLVDIYATMSDILGIDLPEDKSIAPDSFSFKDVLMGKNRRNIRESLITQDVNGMLAIRIGDWKYIDNELPDGLNANIADNIRKNFKPQLYNLKKDPSEQDNLYDREPEIVERLKAELNRLKIEASR